MTRPEPSEPRRWRSPRILGTILTAGVVVVVAVTALASGHLSHIVTTAGGREVGTSSSPFGQHYASLVRRRKAVHLPTMMDTMSSPVHVHPLLRVVIDGKSITVPANIGIDPRQDPMQMAGLHTHDTSGTIHVEGVDHARLGQFFAVWGVPLHADRLGPYRATADKRVRMWVDGKPSTAFGALPLADGQHIVLTYGTDPNPPAG